VECATCGARGELREDLRVHWTDLSKSVISMDEKRDHYFEIRDTAQRQNARRHEIEARAGGYCAFNAFDPVVRPPSHATAGPSGAGSHAQPSSA
jgi:hypothetical protein